MVASEIRTNMEFEIRTNIKCELHVELFNPFIMSSEIIPLSTLSLYLLCNIFFQLLMQSVTLDI